MDKNFLKKTWNFIWHDDSIWSWIINVILAFVLIKFIVYPVLGASLGTTHPIVAVVSGSMEHDGSFDDWFESLNCQKKGEERFTQESIYDIYDIDAEQFQEFKFKNGFNKGDVIVLKKPGKIDVGDVIVFQTKGFSDPIIHRVISTTDGIYTKGDHNCDSAVWEKNIPEENIIGKATLRIPVLGWIKIGFVNLINSWRN